MALLSAWSWAIAISPATALIKAIWGLRPDAMPTGLGRFKLDGRSHRLTLNERGRTYLHGGLIGFSRRGWRILEHTGAPVTLGADLRGGRRRLSGHARSFLPLPARRSGDSEYPHDGRDSPTIVNFAHHAYFTLTANRSAITLCRSTPSMTRRRTPH
jgi:Aldose 1-epimerase